MRHVHVLLSLFVAGFLAFLAYGGAASAQQMSAPEVVQNTKEVTLKSNKPEAIAVNCPEGTKVISGGGGSDVFGASYFAMAWSMPITGQKDEGWSVGMVNRSFTSKKGVIFAFALCSKVK